jgi:thiamine biosynthesis lipoprotein ApbE
VVRRPIEVSETLANLLDAALTAAGQTDGDVDPTVGAAMVALGYDADIATLGRARPLAASITTPAIWSMVTLDDRIVTVPSGILLDLGATGKAVAADQCARRAHDVTSSGVLVNLGGDLQTIEHQVWRAGHQRCVLATERFALGAVPDYYRLASGDRSDLAAGGEPCAATARQPGSLERGNQRPGRSVG